MASQPLPSSILWDVEAPLYEDYEKSFEVVERHIKAGDTHLVNLTSPVAVRCNLSLEEIFLHTQGKYKLMLKNGDQGFVCFSPETFVRINEGRIYSYPMKGTIDAQLPAGSITGAPKAKTVEVIREAEHYDRGYYTGIMGIYDRGNLNTGVMIRFLEQDAHGMCYKAGGGVTSQSVCRKEYEEVIRKVYLPLER